MQTVEKKVNEEAKVMETESGDEVKKPPETESDPCVKNKEQIDESKPVRVETQSYEAVESSSADEKEEKTAEQMETKEETIVKACGEATDEKMAEAKVTVEIVSEEVKELPSIASVEEEHTKMAHVFESTKEEEPLDVHPVKQVSEVKSETTAGEVPQVEAKPDIVEQVETNPVETKETTERVEVRPRDETDVQTVETEDSKERRTHEDDKSTSSELPDQIVLANTDSVSELKRETAEEASSTADVIENVIAEDKEKHVVGEPPKEPCKEDDDTIKRDADASAHGKSGGTSTDAETKEKEKQHDLAAEKVTEAVEIASKESEHKKQEPEVAAKEVSVKPKHSNNIISKVKQSLVKAKKAIIGKSPSSKTISNEAKGEIKVK